MIYKVFFQESKEQTPRREDTKVLYLEVDASTELEGRIIARQLIEEHTNYNVELIQQLSPKALEYEQTHAEFHITEF